MRTIFTDLWQSRNPSGRQRALLLALTPLSWVYGAITARRNRGYDSDPGAIARLSRPVISIGNITVGGTGKTPMTILIARGLQARGFHPAVLSRGYGGRRPGSGNVVSDGTRRLLSPREGGDEPALLAASLPGVPVITGPERFVSGRIAVERFGADVLLLDDGFQHRRLARNVDILLLDGRTPFGNRLLLPAGPLREDPRPALGRADIVVKTDVEPFPTAGAAGWPPADAAACLADAVRPLFRAGYHPTGLTAGGGGDVLPPEILRDKRVLAFTAIANPEKFSATLGRLGAKVLKFLAFPDHYFYKARDVRMIAAEARTLRAEMIVATEKDGVKLGDFQEFYNDIYILRVELRTVPGEGTFFDALIKRMQG